jgi:hypothetical protein
MKWWHRRQALKWERKYVEAIGEMDDVRRGVDSMAFHLAMIDRCQAESALRYYRDKAGLNVYDGSGPQGETPK